MHLVSMQSYNTFFLVLWATQNDKILYILMI